jgi:chemotaxis protein MotB
MTNQRRRKSDHVNNDRWLVSYADFITLLFAFFVVLYAFSKANEKKQIEVTAAINNGFRSMSMFSGTRTGGAGTDEPVLPMNIVMGESVLAPAEVKDDLQRIGRELTQTLSNQVASHTVSIKMGQDGLVISLSEAGFFASGAATPKPEALPILRQIAKSLGQTPYDVRIEGNTDNVPIHTADFDSNWELSTARATRIARLFLELSAIPPERLSAAGYAEFHPIASNDTAQGRALNRRVDLVVTPRTKINFAAGSNSPSGPWRRITGGDEADEAASQQAGESAGK